MEEQLIKFETAKLAKEKGFNISYSLNGFYNESGKYYRPAYGVTLQENEYYPCTQSLLQKWLREKHKRHIELSVDLFDNLETMCFRGFHIIKMDNYKDLYNTNEVFKTYEEALEEGLQKALKLI